MATENITEVRHQRLLEIGLWAAQIMLAVVFALTGSLKAFLPAQTLFSKLPDLATLPLPFIRFLGVAELAAAIGLVLPSVTRVAPVLTPLAACGVIFVMGCAAAFHIRDGHMSELPLVVALGVGAFVVARERFTRARIVPRSEES